MGGTGIMTQEIIPRTPPIPPTAMEVVKEHRAFYRKGTPEYAMFSGIIAAARDASREIIGYEHPHP